MHDLGPREQTPACQYPCPGRCGIYVADGNLPCLACWYRQNPLPEATLRARRLPSDHPRSPAR